MQQADGSILAPENPPGRPTRTVALLIPLDGHVFAGLAGEGAAFAGDGSFEDLARVFVGLLGDGDSPA